MSTAERRLFKRHPLDIAATVITPSASIPVHAVDICAGGIRVLSPDPILPETEIALSLATEAETLLSGSILWTIEIQGKNSPPLFEVGIAADAIILKEREAIGLADRQTFVREILSRVRKTRHRE